MLNIQSSIFWVFMFSNKIILLGNKNFIRKETVYAQYLNLIIHNIWIWIWFETWLIAKYLQKYSQGIQSQWHFGTHVHTIEFYFIFRRSHTLSTTPYLMTRLVLHTPEMRPVMPRELSEELMRWVIKHLSNMLWPGARCLISAGVTS